EGRDSEAVERPLMLGEVFGRLGWLPAVRLNALWTAAAGRVLASHSRVTGRREGDLTIECSSAEWMAQLADVEAELVVRLKALGLPWIEKLQLDVIRVSAPPSSKPKSRSLPARRVQQIHSSVAEVESPPIREALERVLRAYALSGIDETKSKEKP